MNLIAPTIKLIILLLFGGCLVLLAMDYLRFALRQVDLRPLPRLLALAVQLAVVLCLTAIYIQLGGGGLNYRPGGVEEFGYDVFLNINSFNLALLALCLFALFFSRLAAALPRGGELPYLILVVGILGAGFAGDILNIYLYYELFILTSLYISRRSGDKRVAGRARLQLIGSFLILFVLFLVFHYAGSFHLEKLLKVAALPTARQPLSAVLLLFSLAMAVKGGIIPFGSGALAAGREAMEGDLLRGAVSIFLLCRVAFPFSRLEYRLGWLFILWGVLAVSLAIFKTWREGALYSRMVRAAHSLFGFALISLGLGLEYSSLDCYAAAIRFIALSFIVLTGLVLLWPYATSAALPTPASACRQTDGWMDGLIGFFLACSLIGLPPLESFWGKYCLARGVYSLPGGVFIFIFTLAASLALAVLLMPGAYRRLTLQGGGGESDVFGRVARVGFFFLLAAISMDAWWGSGFVRPAAEYIIDYLSY